MQSQGGKVVELFPSVVKLVASHNPEVKRIVHRYLIQYAELEPQLTLLAINLLKKDLGSNPLACSQALRTLSSLRVKAIQPVVARAVAQCATHSSPYVRKTTAHALPKLVAIDGTQLEEMEGIVERLLHDRSTLVLGSTVAAFNAVRWW